MNEYINLAVLDHIALDRLVKLDRGFIGTPHYMGVAYFWNYEYRHTMRDASIAKSRKVHGRIIEAGYSPSAKNETIDIIIETVTGVHQ